MNRTTTPPAGRTALRLLRDHTVAAYFLGKLFGSIGVWIHNVVAALVVYDLTGSAFLVGMVSVAQFVPQMLVAPYAGVLADRGDPRRQANMGRTLGAVGSGALAVWIWTVGLSGPLGAAPVIVGAALVGTGFAIANPALHAIVPSLVERDELPAMVAIDTSPLTVARSIGPALGALLMAFGGPATAFAVAAACQFTLTVVLRRIRLRELERAEGGDGSLMGGLRHLRADPVVALLLLGVIGLGFGVDPVITLTPAIAAGFGQGARLVAVMATFFGLGAATAPLVLGLLRRFLREPGIATFGFGLMILGLLGLAYSPRPNLAVGALYLGGIGLMLGVTTMTTQLQQRVPNHLRGRVMALWSVAFVGSRPLAAATNGALADLLSPRAALLVLLVALGVIAVVTRPSRVERGRTV